MNLRTQVIRGGFYLTIRQALGMLIGAGGVLLLTRNIGPTAYGVYAAAFGVYLYIYNISQWGIQVYLVRKEGDVKEEEYHQAFLLFILIGVSGAIISLLCVPLLERWFRFEGFRSVATVLFLVLPISLVSLAPLAQLERSLEYQRVTLIELTGQLVYYVVALPLAFKSFGVWAPVVGLWAKEGTLLILLYTASRYRPRFHWEWRLVKEMLGYGIGYSASVWLRQLYFLVNPLIVGRFLGAKAVGYIALTILLVEHLSFLRSVACRLSLVALARLQENRTRLAQAITEGMQLQIIVLGPLLVVFGWAVPWLLPLLFGEQWLPVVNVYPFIALSYLTNALFNLHVSALFVLRRNWQAAVFHLVHIVLFAGGTLLLVHHIGLMGYAWAEILALPSYLLLYAFVLRNVGRVLYLKAGILFLAFSVTLFSYQLGWWTILSMSLLLLLMWRSSWPELIRLLRMVTLRGLI